MNSYTDKVCYAVSESAIRQEIFLLVVLIIFVIIFIFKFIIYDKIAYNSKNEKK